MRLLREGTRFLGLWIGAEKTDAAALQEIVTTRPLDVHAVAPEAELARQLGLAAGTGVLVRPDAYIAAQIDAPTPALIDAALRRALALEAAA
jgi:hypothetical protein